ncbi:MAG: hypothetical protein E6R03_17050 [Hyphomicrobiaceae bacterium]|nr:MAG: hypothetical protein E6R03_17050 [Hyphomicrobiaceae bacterium]
MAECTVTERGVTLRLTKEDCLALIQTLLAEHEGRRRVVAIAELLKEAWDELNTQTIRTDKA